MFRTRTLLALIGISAFALAACGDSGDGEGGHGGEHSHGGEGEGGDGEGGGTGGTPSEGGGGGVVELNGCTRETAEDLTAQAAVDLEWTLTHQECVVVAVGTVVTWTGDFSFHPLAGGETGTEDASSPITTSDQTGDSASVTFDAAGEFPYFCTVHSSSMQGVIYVE